MRAGLQRWSAALERCRCDDFDDAKNKTKMMVYLRLLSGHSRLSAISLVVRLCVIAAIPRDSPPHFRGRSLALAVTARLHGSFSALCTAGALCWPVILSYDYDLSFTHTHALLCSAWLLLQRRLGTYLPRRRVLRWQPCTECFLLPSDSLHCRRIECAAVMLLEC